jgi:hypothetical protein
MKDPMHNGVLFSLKEWNHAMFKKMDGPRDHHTMQNKPDWERQIPESIFWK